MSSEFVSCTLALNPRGRLLLDTGNAASVDDPALLPAETVRLLDAAFRESGARGLLALSTRRDNETTLPPVFAFWRAFTDTYLTALAHTPDLPDGNVLSAEAMPLELGMTLALRLPAMPGAEYVTPELFATLWNDLNALAHDEALSRRGGVRQWVNEINPSLRLLGKVTFHLAENKRSPETPFAFMVTYTHRLSAQEKPVHWPLARALQEYAGARNQEALRSLLEPIRAASEQSKWTSEMLESRRIFQPQSWTPSQAHTFLREVPILESAGIITRIPNWWKNGIGKRPLVRVTIGEQRGAGLSAESILDFSVAATLDGLTLTHAELKALMKSTDGLVSLRGQWVEADPEKLKEVLDRWKRVESTAKTEGVSFLEAMRLIAGVNLGDARELAAVESADWSEVVEGAWLRETLEQLRAPEGAAAWNPNERLHGTLRPYQETGVKWLWFLQQLGLGACLADDMGLGKTIQVLALLLRIKYGDDARKIRGDRSQRDPSPSLLIAPASLLANWRSELERFAPDLRAGFVHPSETPTAEWRDAKSAEEFIAGKDLIVTTYGQTMRLDWLAARTWRLLVLDEAQAIKNPGARQTRAVKNLRAQSRIALSGTPVENRLGDLWSLYDFLNPGLLGNAAQFGRYVKSMQTASPPDLSPLRRLVKPYLLRRLKTDRAIINDLPDKTEQTAWCPLTKRQAALYERNVRELATDLESAEEGIKRRGLVLAFLMRFKQICNHPSQWLGDNEFAREESGKFQRLVALCDEIASRQEKALVFTQFKEMTSPLADLLAEVFGRAGLVLHGSTPVKERRKRVEAFQRDDGPPFFVLSLKAGGTGLNLTAANHVIHFDRWWNPAVENQATDRAFRIGQKKNVLVHKFVCRGTIEERIDALITAKKSLAESVVGGGAESQLTEMSNDELLRFVGLNVTSALGE